MQDQDWQEMQRKQREYEKQQPAAGEQAQTASKSRYPLSYYTLERPGCITAYAMLLAMSILFNGYFALGIWGDYISNDLVCKTGAYLDCGPYREMFTDMVGVPPALFLAYTALAIGTAIYAIPRLWQMQSRGWWAVVILQTLNIIAVIFIKSDVTIPQLIGTGVVLFWFLRNQHRFD